MRNLAKRSNPITQGARILVVDDDSDGAEAAGKLLETFGCNVSLVVSAGEALERIEEGADIDLVFSDVVMPDIDGLEFAERLNALLPAQHACGGKVPRFGRLAFRDLPDVHQPDQNSPCHRLAARRKPADHRVRVRR